MVERIQEKKAAEDSEGSKISVQEVEISLPLLNNKLNYIINLLEK